LPLAIAGSSFSFLISSITFNDESSRDAVESQQAGTPNLVLSQAKLDGNKRVGAWLPHDASRAHEMLGNLEESVHFAREFFYLAEEMQALHPLKRSIEYVNILAQKYNDVASVRNLSEEVQQLIHDKEHTLPENGEITKSNTPG
jgi:hypothetical protein